MANRETKNGRQRRRRLVFEQCEPRRLFAGLPYGAMPQDTGEFMLGRIAVTPVFLESSGQRDASTENWNSALIQQTLQTVQTGANWWVDLLAAQNTVHSLEFVFDTTYATTPVATEYEPISRRSDDYAQWVEEFLTGVGQTGSSSIEVNMRAFNDSQRQKLSADWSFTMFVINSNADPDGQFANGGSFSRAFAFAGGLFLVSPSTRPASTFTHEIGHMFWAKDEYPGGASSADFRGYYNTQNLNASDNSTPGFVQQPSIMAAGSLLDTAYNNHVSPASTLAMIGWQDSDGDGIFDVLDVPLELSGTGYYDTATSSYKFRGSAKVGTLPNLNPEGLRNDITLNKVSQIQYRVNAGAWTTISSPNQYEVDLDLTIPLASVGQTIQLRAVDARTGITSNVFEGRFNRSDAVVLPGVNGFVWIDANNNGQRDAGELGAAGWTVELLTAAGQALNLRRNVEPDSLPDGALTSTSVAGVNITAVGNDTDGRAGVFSDVASSTGAKTFRAYSKSTQSWSSTWSGVTRRMRVDFTSATSVVEIDAIGSSADTYGRMEAYDASGNLLDRFTTSKLGSGQVAKMRVESNQGNIAYVLIGGHASTTVRLDNLRYGPETSIVTASRGQYAMPLVPAGNYMVKVTPSGTYQPLTSGGNQLSTTVTAGVATTDVDFGFRSSGSTWQNPQDQYDVNGIDGVTALDVLLIINEINENGPRDLAQANFQAPPYVDVNGDGFCTALDALQVINVINARSSGEGEPKNPSDSQASPWVESNAWLVPGADEIDLLANNRSKRR